MSTKSVPRISQSILEFFGAEGNRALIEKLRVAGLTFTAEKRKKTSQLEGLSFVLTGSLPNLTREDAKTKIESAGGRVRFHQQEDPLHRCRRRCRLEARQGARELGGCVRRGRSAPITQCIAVIVSSCGLLPEPALNGHPIIGNREFISLESSAQG